jgi:hypothetical protein
MFSFAYTTSSKKGVGWRFREIFQSEKKGSAGVEFDVGCWDELRRVWNEEAVTSFKLISHNVSR